MMAAELPRGRFRDRISKRRKDTTVTSSTVTTKTMMTTASKSTMDLPALVRAGPQPPPQARLSHARLSLRGAAKGAYATVSVSRLTKSLSDAVVDDSETKRRKKLRDVIAMMEMSKRQVKRKNDVETHTNERMKAAEAVKRRVKSKAKAAAVKPDADDDDDVMDDEEDEEEEHPKERAIATMGKWQSFVMKKKAFSRGRRSGFAGRLPIKKSGAATDDKKSTEVDTKPKTLGRFKTNVKLIIYLLRLSKTYILKESDARMVSLFTDIDAARVGDHYKIRGDLLYDVSEFRAQKSQRISNDTRRILLKDSDKRSKKDVHHVMVELQQMKSITQYPVDMQRGLVANSWYEEYPTGRVIIRYGRSPQAFYVILGGSALHLEGDPNIPGRPVSSLNKGDMFGEQAIAHQNKHVYTVISKEAIQLMCLSPEDYCRIFLAGGLDNFGDLGEHSFVRSVSIFKHWPIHLLKNNHKQTRFQYFVHGSTIVEDSNKSDWIIIVKSGSCSVLKRLVDPTYTTVPAVVPVIKRKKSVVPSIRFKKDFIQPAESHQDMLTRKLKELQKKRAKQIKNSRWQRYIKKPTSLIKIPLHDDPFEEPTMSQNYYGENDPIRAGLFQRHEQSLKERLKPTELSKNDDIIEEHDTPDDSMMEDGNINEQGEIEEEPMDTSESQVEQTEAEIVERGRKQSFAKGPFMTHRARMSREPSKMNDGNDATRKGSHSRRDSLAQLDDPARKDDRSNRDSGTSHTDGTSRRNSLARRDSVMQGRGSRSRRDSMALMESNEGGRESVTQDSGMTDLTEATHTTDGQGTAGNGEEADEGEESEDDDSQKNRAPPEPVHKFVMIDTLEKGGVFGVLDIAFGPQSSLSLVSNGAECIMVKKKFYLKHVNDKTVWNITQTLRPYPNEDTLTNDLKEKLTWKDHRDATLKATALKFKKMRKRMADPRIQRPAAIVETYT